MPKRFKTDHDAITALIVSFDDFKDQDKQDKLLIRSDIKDLKEGVVGRIDNCEHSVAEIIADKADLRKVAIQIDQRLTRMETTVYGPNRDGKGGGAEAIVDLKLDIRSIWKTIAIYTSIIVPILGIIFWLIINHINSTANFVK